ncbi:rRNA cytosine-C5-methyltransferase [Nibrella viscosa]|uniref:rRNA cytosine-C5-methyltransferase n=1 Tax=Nibrella viscosa TaxID=1084524 RepID=A0ABP8KPE0_9BACT
MNTIPQAFRERMQAQLGSEYPAFEAALTQEAPVSIRVNPRKSVLPTDSVDRVPWCFTGYYLPERPVFTLDPLFQAGAYYVQEASSMLLAEAIRQTAKMGRPLRVLDLCAAPGGKSTLLASMLHPESLLVCNEVIRTRVPVLRENIDKWGYPNVVVSNHDPDDFAGLTGFFDVVVVDAPCSGEGLFRKDPDAVEEWSEGNVDLCSARQKRILSAAAPLVDKGGLLIYSTCTYNDKENTENAHRLTGQQFTSRRLTLPAEWGVVEKIYEGAYGYQCYPHRVRGEGFFISIFQKQTEVYNSQKNMPRGFKSMKPVHARQAKVLAEWLANPNDFSYWQKPNQEIIAVPVVLEKELITVDLALRNKGFGVDMGVFKGNDFIPSHALALSTAVNPELPGIELSREEALRYFKKESLVLNEQTRGWLLARYQGLNLGWLKGVGNRVNNYLPKDWRIRMDIKEYA